MNVGDPVRVVNPQGRLDLPLQEGTITRIAEAITFDGDEGEPSMYRVEGSSVEFWPDELELVRLPRAPGTYRLIVDPSPVARAERPTLWCKVTISRHFDARPPSDAAQQMADWLVENARHAT